jgi:hypothetical protein
MKTELDKQCVQSDRYMGRAINQVICRRPVTIEDRVQYRAGPYGICGGNVVLGQVFD